MVDQRLLGTNRYGTALILLQSDNVHISKLIGSAVHNGSVFSAEMKQGQLTKS